MYILYRIAHICESTNPSIYFVCLFVSVSLFVFMRVCPSVCASVDR
jgi:hypothetical protein